MSKIVSVKKAAQISKEFKANGRKIILAGGCFDILHIGHIAYLTGAKKQGDVLFVLLESDENIKKTKGERRPINSQSDRAAILGAISMVDYIIPIKKLNSNEEYDELVKSIKPAIIAITKGDPGKSDKERQGELIGARVVEVSDNITNQSTTKLIKILSDI